MATCTGPFLFAIPSLYALEKDCQGGKSKILVATKCKYKNNVTHEITKTYDEKWPNSGEKFGLERLVEKVIVARYKGNSSQQMGCYGRVPVRESVVVWRKRP